MASIYETAVLNSASLPGAAWDLTSFLTNAKTQIQVWGGLLLMLIGVVALCYGGYLFVKKVWSSPQNAGQQQGWGMIALTIIAGGALATGGFGLMNTIGSGGQQTIEDLGGGTVVVQPWEPSSGR